MVDNCFVENNSIQELKNKFFNKNLILDFLPFRGFYTDGGIGQNDLKYWI